MQVSCPTCRRSVVWSAESPSRPFCSERCRLIDLGQWLAADEPADEAGDTDGVRMPKADAAKAH